MTQPAQRVIKFFPTNKKVPFIITSEGTGLIGDYLIDENELILTDENDIPLTE